MASLSPSERPSPEHRSSSASVRLRRALLAALSFHINLLEATSGYLPGNWDILWSLSVEEMFYLFFPLVARLVHSKKLLALLLTLFTILGPFARAKAFNHNPIWREYSYLGSMNAIALGCLTAMMRTNRQLSRNWIYALAGAGASLLISSLCFSDQAYKWGLGRNGLNMTILAVGVCLLITASTESQWHAPRIFRPLRILGQRSYEIYLTHMFAVMTLFAVFLRFGKPLHAVPVLFVSATAVAGLLGWLVAVFFTEPMNQLIRKRAALDRTHIGAAMTEVD